MSNENYINKLANSIEHYTNVLSEVLYEYDPANTCCKENEATDEYDSVALSILEDYIKDDLKRHIQNNINYYFAHWVDDDEAEVIVSTFINNIS